MPRILRIFTVLSLPILTLLLGWQLGGTYERKQLEDATQTLNEIYSGESGSATVISDPEEEVDISLLWGVWRLLLKHYIAPDELQTTPLLFGAVEGMVRAVGDPYTVFMTPSQNVDFRQALEGKLQGIGAELTFKDGLIVVVNPLKGSPAAAAGILPEDIITEVDGTDIAGENLNQVVQRIRGKKGTTVRIKVVREGSFDPIEFSIVRADINIPSVESELKKTGSGTVGYIALNQFGDSSVDEVKEALVSFEKESIEGVILDLRFNGGGYLEGAVELASLFLRQGKVVSVERRDGEPEHHYVYGRPTHPDVPLVVMINQGSASASEIVAGALQDHKRATIIGMTSFGKGTVQEVIDLPGGSSLRVTTARWLTPSGKNLGKEGVHPDIVVDRTTADYENERDPQLQAALEWLLDKQDVTKGRR
ncbi:S41 family peptidase [Candidatus Peregrinibacteria bacterium]|nr:S41 family peptidase [Candidatus Peregrinibacteria bacterium]